MKINLIKVTPMSHTERIIGLPGLKVERVKRKQGIEVWVKPA